MMCTGLSSFTIPLVSLVVSRLLNILFVHGKKYATSGMCIRAQCINIVDKGKKKGGKKKRQKMTLRACITSHIYLIDESKSHLILLMMTKINNFAALLQPTLAENNAQKTINLELLSKLGPQGTEISVQTQRLHSLNNFAGDDEITSY